MPSVATATWDGGGAPDCAFTTAANWVGDETPGLAATNSFAGDVRINGGVMKISSKKQPFGTAVDGGTVTLNQTLGAVWEQYDGTIDKPLTVVGGNVSDGGLYGSICTARRRIWATS